MSPLKSLTRCEDIADAVYEIEHSSPVAYRLVSHIASWLLHSVFACFILARTYQELDACLGNKTNSKSDSVGTVW